jgi:hypothetical protein
VTAPVLVFVNERAVRVPPGTTAEGAVRAADPALAARLGEGAGYVTDGRGIRLDAASPVYEGAILRVVVSARREGERDEADAEP